MVEFQAHLRLLFEEKVSDGQGYDGTAYEKVPSREAKVERDKAVDCHRVPWVQ